MTKKKTAASLPDLSASESELVESFRRMLSDGEGLETPAEREELLDRLGASRPSALHAVRAALEAPSARSAGLLAELELLVSEKDLKKSVRRALHILEQKGFSKGETPQGKSGGVFRKVEKPESVAYESEIDTAGIALLMLATPRPAVGLKVAVAVVKPGVELTDFHAMEMTRSDFRAFVKGFNGEQASEVIPIPWEHGVYLFKEALEATERAGGTLPGDLGDWRSRIEREKIDRKESEVYEWIPKETVEGNAFYLKDSETLLDKNPCRLWLLEEEELEPYIRRMEEIETSVLALSEPQQKQRISDLLLEAVGELFTPERRYEFRRRLEETAFIFLLKGERERAKVALATALDLTGEHVFVPENPFLVTLLDVSIGMRAIESERTEGGEPDGESPLIIL